MKIKLRNQEPIEELDAELGEFLKAEMTLKEQLVEIGRLAGKYAVRFLQPLIEARGKREVITGIKYERLPEFFDADALAREYGSIDPAIKKLAEKGYKFLSTLE
jgi:hypothetical protein